MEGSTGFDHRLPEVRAEFGMVRAEFAARSGIRAHAEQLWAIELTLDEARSFPEIFVGPGLAHEKDAVEFAERAAAADLAVRLSISEYAVRAYGRQAHTMLRRTPRMWFAFREGEVSIPNARIAAELAESLPQSAWAAFEDAVLDCATTLAPPRFKAFARAARERVEPESFVERHARSRDDRLLWV